MQRPAHARLILFDLLSFAWCLRGEGPKPTDAEMDESRALRSEAKVLFERAIKHVDTASSSFGPLPE